MTSTYLKDVNQLSVCSSHLVRIHNLVSTPELKYLLIKLRIRFKVTICE